MKKILFSIASMTTSLSYALTFPAVQTVEEVQNELNFLTSSSDQVGITYKGIVGSLNGLTLPLSYYTTPRYWGEYVASIPGNDLQVDDEYISRTHALTPTLDSPGRELQIERVTTHCGTSISDAACWQMALGICAKEGLKISSKDALDDLFALAENQDRLLFLGYDGDASQIHFGANRAVTRDDGTFGYNGTSITDESKAYFFSRIPRSWLVSDPFIDTPYMRYIGMENLPPHSVYQEGKMTWVDRKPLTGENAWAFYIGPLQTAYLKQQALGEKHIPITSTAVYNALNSLFALRSMQSELGSIYYACSGTIGQDDKLISPYEVSIENNISALAGLMIFKQVLQDQLKHQPNLHADQKEDAEIALKEVNTMLFGGSTPQGLETKGLLSFLKNHAWDESSNGFYLGGEANNPKLEAEWEVKLAFKAVDVNTSGVAVLGQPLLDSWYGFGSAFQAWQGVKAWGAFYGPDHELWGVGYSDQDGNGVSGNYQNGIMAANSTAGAINMLRCLIEQYTAAATSSGYAESAQKQALQYVADLQKDHDSMYSHLLSLRSDLYPLEEAYAAGRPDQYQTLVPIPSGKLALIETSKRFVTSFGEHVNPLPSTASTSWAIMLHYNFNPFKIGGDYVPYSFEDDSASQKASNLIANAKDGLLGNKEKAKGHEAKTKSKKVEGRRKREPVDLLAKPVHHEKPLESAKVEESQASQVGPGKVVVSGHEGTSSANTAALNEKPKAAEDLIITTSGEDSKSGRDTYFPKLDGFKEKMGEWFKSIYPF